MNLIKIRCSNWRVAEKVFRFFLNDIVIYKSGKYLFVHLDDSEKVFEVIDRFEFSDGQDAPLVL